MMIGERQHRRRHADRRHGRAQPTRRRRGRDRQRRVVERERVAVAATGPRQRRAQLRGGPKAILAPLADFANVSRSTVVTAFQSASGLVNLVTPTSAVIMGGLALSKVGYDRYLKFVWPFLTMVFLVCCVFVGISAATS